MAGHPGDGVRWVLDHARPRSPLELGVPWTSWTCIEFMKRHVRPGMRVFEYGGGGSTRFFLNMGCSVTTIESELTWIEQIEKWSRHDGTLGNLELRHRPVRSKADSDNYARELTGDWDVIFIDGVEDEYGSRTSCLDWIRSRQNASDWLVILDDSWRAKYVPHLLGRPKYQSVLLPGLGPARLGVTQAHAFFRPQGRFDR